MANYYAVLERTLSGFTDPKDQLRTKLYERARSTIKRQLEGRNPPVEGDALVAELEKLETAISDIEKKYVPGGEAVVPSPEPLQEQPKEPTPEPVSEPVKEAPTVLEPAPMPELVSEKPPIPLNLPEATSSVEPEAPLISEMAPGKAVEEMPDLEITIPTLEAEETPAIPPIPAAPSISTPNPLPQIDPVDEWAKEFSSEPSAAPVVPEVPPIPVVASTPAAPIAPLEPVTLEPVTLPEAPILPEIPAVPVVPAPPILTSPAPALNPVPPAVSDVFQENIVIPPAGGFSKKKPQKKGFGKWLLMLLLLGALGAAAAYGWNERETLIEKFGLENLFDDPTRPKPVKTITIKPDPELPKPETNANPKSETRLTSDGVEVEPASILPATVTQPAPLPAKPASTAIPIAQNAILYEKGSNAAGNSSDVGRVVWSVVQEEPSVGLPKEPVINARVEFPGRKMILIMKIKRNTDRSLPASHLIELVFAVPDDFSGGGINQINRFVFKESEQGRGDGLVAVPAKIQEGIFLVALTNLDKDLKKNMALMQTRGWIDIPVQYSTGRSALVTLEKGIPGENVFKEVFAAWKILG